MRLATVYGRSISRENEVSVSCHAILVQVIWSKTEQRVFCYIAEI